MCLAVPGKIISIDNELDDIFRIAKVSFDGVVKEVNLAMLPEAKLGDYVLVHVGSAISIVDEKEALFTLDILKKLDKGKADFFNVLVHQMNQRLLIENF